jgi:hypothetical protein
MEGGRAHIASRVSSQIRLTLRFPCVVFLEDLLSEGFFWIRIDTYLKPDDLFILTLGFLAQGLIKRFRKRRFI